MTTSNSDTEPPSPNDPSLGHTTQNLGRPQISRLSLPSSFFLPGTPGYDSLELIGEGGMGAVYRARDMKLKRLVALKMLKAGTLTAERLARFHTEAEALGRLAHPHIVPVFAWDDQGPYLVMEYVPGGTLEAKLEKGPLAFEEAARLVAALARAVQAAHDAGVIHRDLKPGNVLFGPPVPGNSGTVCSGFPKVSDFGLAQLVDAGRGVTASGFVLGTPAYMAPEQATGDSKKIGPPVDVWALGVILYEVLTGRMPFKAADPDELVRSIINRPPRPPRALRRDTPPTLESACLACLKKDPEARPTAAGLATRLERYLLQAPAGSETEKPAESRRPRRPLSQLALGGLLAVVMGGILGVMATRLPSRPPRIATLRVTLQATGTPLSKTGGVRPGDRVRVEAELSAPAHAVLIELEADGSVVERAREANTRSIRYPPDGDSWHTIEKLEVGMQAFVVIASRELLPPIEIFRKRLKGIWHKIPASQSAITVEDGEIRPFVPGHPLHGPPGDLVPHMERLSQALRGSNSETVRLVAFPVSWHDDRPNDPPRNR